MGGGRSHRETVRRRAAGPGCRGGSGRSGVRVDFGVREPHGLAQRPGVGDFGSGAVSDVVADYEHLISEPDLRPVQIVEPNLQRLGLDRIGPKFVRRLHVTARFDDNLSGFGLPQIGLVHLGHEAGGAADYDDTREAQQLLRVGELLLGGEQLRV